MRPSRLGPSGPRASGPAREPRRVGLAVAAGGALGSLGRWSLVDALPRDGWPWGTLLVNVTGALTMGLLVAWLSTREAPDWVRPFVATGLLGGWTTYSAFALDTVTLSPFAGLGYVLATVVLGVGACALGLRTAEIDPTRAVTDETPRATSISAKGEEA